ncbi:MAG: glycosyltransferase family 10 [Patescibacteria group bacterium]|nr:glycosyltransferase family 10 [Patescibacteria group bacterium]MCL5431592.1 glycosyltransferase family 10 [Patescibacteria group bacterium]
MKKIFLAVPNPLFANNGIFTRKDWNHTFDCWRGLRVRLKKLGYSLTTPDNNSLSGCEWVIFIDTSSVDGLSSDKSWPNRQLYSEALRVNLKSKMILFLWEGKVINSINYARETWDKFDNIFTWDDDLVDNHKFHKFYLPVPNVPPVKKTIPFNKKKLLVNISINKYAKGPNELYSARRKTIEYFDNNFPNDFDLFGPRWNKPINTFQKYLPWTWKKYRTYRGVSFNKLKTLSQYKFTLCYENMTGSKGWVTEKIFDALKAKSVPIYWGAPNIGKYVDNDVFIDRRNFSSEEKLAKFLMHMTENEYNNYIISGEQYIKSSRFNKFSSRYFGDTILKLLKINA